MVATGKTLNLITLVGNVPQSWCIADSSLSWPLLFLQPASVLRGWDQREGGGRQEQRRGGGLKIYDPPVYSTDTITQSCFPFVSLHDMSPKLRQIVCKLQHGKQFSLAATALQDSAADMLTARRDSQHMLYSHKPYEDNTFTHEAPRRHTTHTTQNSELCTTCIPCLFSAAWIETFVVFWGWFVV